RGAGPRLRWLSQGEPGSGRHQQLRLVCQADARNSVRNRVEASPSKLRAGSGRVGEWESGGEGERESGGGGEGERGRVGERESGRAGEWESGRAGERESGGEGEWES